MRIENWKRKKNSPFSGVWTGNPIIIIIKKSRWFKMCSQRRYSCILPCMYPSPFVCEAIERQGQVALLFREDVDPVV